MSAVYIDLSPLVLHACFADACHILPLCVHMKTEGYQVMVTIDAVGLVCILGNVAADSG